MTASLFETCGETSKQNYGWTIKNSKVHFKKRLMESQGKRRLQKRDLNLNVVFCPSIDYLLPVGHA